MTRIRLIEIIGQEVEEKEKLEEWHKAFQEALMPKEVKPDLYPRTERNLESLVEGGRINEERLRFTLEGPPFYSEDFLSWILDKAVLSLALFGQFYLENKRIISLGEKGKQEAFDLVGRLLLECFSDEGSGRAGKLRDLLLKSIVMLYGHNREKTLRLVSEVRLTSRQRRILFNNFDAFDRQKK